MRQKAEPAYRGSKYVPAKQVPGGTRRGGHSTRGSRKVRSKARRLMKSRKYGGRY